MATYTVDKINFASNIYKLQDAGALQLTGGSVTGPVTFGDSVSMDNLSVGTLSTTGNATFTNNIQANTINGVTVGSSPKFTDTISTVSTSGSGDAITAITASNGAITATKGNSSRRFFYGTCATAAATAAKEVTISNTTGWQLLPGTAIGVLFTYSNSASSVTLNVNGTGAKSIRYNNAIYTSTSTDICGYASRINYYVYDGTNWCFMSNGISNSNTYDRTYLSNSGYKAGSTAIVAANIITANSSGLYQHLKSGAQFDITMPILYAGSACNANTVNNSGHICIPFTITTTQSITLTAYKPIYIKGTLAGKLFTPVSTTPLTQTQPTSADGYEYMFLGYATTTTVAYLLPEHPIYAYTGGAFTRIGGKGITDISRSGTTFTATREDGSTFTFTQQDTVPTVPSAGTTATAVGTTSSGGSASTYSKSDHVHNITSATITGALGYEPNKVKINQNTSGDSYLLTGSTSGSNEETTTLVKHSSAYIRISSNSSTDGYTVLVLGNSESSSSAGGKHGILELYGDNNRSTMLLASTTTYSKTVYLPEDSGTLALTSQVPSIQIVRW